MYRSVADESYIKKINYLLHAFSVFCFKTELEVDYLVLQCLWYFAQSAAYSSFPISIILQTWIR